MYREIDLSELNLANGYVYFSDKNHPLANGYVVYYHRHVVSIVLGRWLSTEEHVHHIDGNKQNNCLHNLEILSREEHALLHHSGRKLDEVICTICGKVYKPHKSDQKFCSVKCAHVPQQKLNNLTREELEYLIWTKPFTTLAKQFNCSDNGVKKWAQRLGCRLPPSRFHNKFRSLEDKLVEFNKRD